MLSDKIELQRTIVGCLFCILMICFCAPLIHDCRADALPGSISGTVTGFADEKAIEGALVNVYDDGWAFVASTTTDALGRYGIEGLAVGRYYVKASNSQDHEDKYCCFTGTQGSASQVYLQYFSREVDFALFEKTPSVQKDIIIDFGPGIGLWAR